MYRLRIFQGFYNQLQPAYLKLFFAGGAYPGLGRFRQQVTVRVSGNDRYGRAIGTLFLDGVNINHWMVAEGWAWAYRPYVVDRRLFEIEAAAKAAGRGLWSEPEPVPPWEWRRRRP